MSNIIKVGGTTRAMRLEVDPPVNADLQDENGQNPPLPGNMAEVCDWCHGYISVNHARHYQLSISLGAKGHMPVNHGEWVVLLAPGMFLVVPNTEDVLALLPEPD